MEGEAPFRLFQKVRTLSTPSLIEAPPSDETGGLAGPEGDRRRREAESFPGSFFFSLRGRFCYRTSPRCFVLRVLSICKPNTFVAEVSHVQFILGPWATEKPRRNHTGTRWRRMNSLAKYKKAIAKSLREHRKLSNVAINAN